MPMYYYENQSEYVCELICIWNFGDSVLQLIYYYNGIKLHLRIPLQLS